jgi:hypothetical protein
VSTAISFDPEAAANALLAEQSERERVVRELAASYGDILERERELDTARATHLQLRTRASQFGITDAALKKAGIPPVVTGSRRNGSTTRRPRRSASAVSAPVTHDPSSFSNSVDSPNDA